MNQCFLLKDTDGDEEEEEDMVEYEEEALEEELYFPHELMSPTPVFEYGRDIVSPKSLLEQSLDFSRASSELTFSEYVMFFYLRCQTCKTSVVAYIYICCVVDAIVPKFLLLYVLFCSHLYAALS